MLRSINLEPYCYGSAKYELRFRFKQTKHEAQERNTKLDSKTYLSLWIAQIKQLLRSAVLANYVSRWTLKKKKHSDVSNNGLQGFTKKKKMIKKESFGWKERGAPEIMKTNWQNCKLCRSEFWPFVLNFCKAHKFDRPGVFQDTIVLAEKGNRKKWKRRTLFTCNSFRIQKANRKWKQSVFFLFTFAIFQ